MPVYNCDRYIQAAIESIERQSLTSWELIVIDDGSTDGTMALLNTFNDPRIRVFQNERNEGVVFSLNRGVSLASGEFLARMDGDDICMSDRLSTQVSYLKAHPDVDICGSWIRIFGKNQRVLGKENYPEDDDSIRALLLFHPAVAHPAVMIRRSALSDDSVKYEASAIHAEDFDLWVRMSATHKFANVQRVLLKYRVHNGNVTQMAQSRQIERRTVFSGIYRRSFNRLQLDLDEERLETHLRFCHPELFASCENEELLNWLKSLSAQILPKFRLSAKTIGAVLYEQLFRYTWHQVRQDPAALTWHRNAVSELGLAAPPLRELKLTVVAKMRMAMRHRK